MEQGQEQRYEPGDLVQVELKKGSDWWGRSMVECAFAAGDYLVVVMGKPFRVGAEQLRPLPGRIQ